MLRRIAIDALTLAALACIGAIAMIWLVTPDAQKPNLCR